MDDRRSLESRLDVLLQRRQAILEGNVATEWQVAAVGELRELDQKIEATARELRPDFPGAALRQSHWRLDAQKLGKLMARRSAWVVEPGFASEAERTHVRRLERRILDLARRLNPEKPQTAISLGAGLGQRSATQEWSAQRRDRLLQVTGRLRRLLRVPEPSQLARITSVLADLKRLEQLEHESVFWARRRSQLAHRGNVIEIKRSIERIEDPRKMLETGFERVYRNPSAARRLLGASWREDGTYATILRFQHHPRSFGKLLGQDARQAVDEIAHSAFDADWKRSELEESLESTRQYQGLQNANRDVVRALGSRETLLSELGRHMEGLELHEVHPVMLHGQARMIQDVRRAEHTFLKPLREASQRLGQSPLKLREAEKIAALFKVAPQHIVQRLAAPQIQVVMVAVSMVRTAARTVTKSMAV